ncbi:MAG: hypothetical protein LBN00_06380 [Oscillospiraceae bacterium]|jgi:hypothetical protein|nr:hypothetical protein [Oscillospiraceae bacterium]
MRGKDEKILPSSHYLVDGFGWKPAKAIRVYKPPHRKRKLRGCKKTRK